MRTHRSWAVNISPLLSYHRGRVMVRYRDSTQEIPISDKWREEFLSGLLNLRAD